MLSRVINLQMPRKQHWTEAASYEIHCFPLDPNEHFSQKTRWIQNNEVMVPMVGRVPCQRCFGDLGVSASDDILQG